MREHCGGCGRAVRAACHGSLLKLGARKAHWESWAACNLGCQFCYRTLDPPLATPEAELLLAALATAGIETVVFAGGDPSLRRDIGHLLGVAAELGLQTEVHTNAQYAPASFREALTRVSCVGLSLDGPTPEVHDSFRDKPGNFRRVLDLLAALEEAGVPVIVRTVVAGPNHHRVAEIADLLLDFGNVAFWYLLEFAAVGTGFQNRRRYELDRVEFDKVAVRATARTDGRLTVHPRRLEDKERAYVMLTPGGRVYGTASLANDGLYPCVGSILHDHLSDLAVKVKFERHPHEDRYQIIDKALRRKRAELANGSG